MERDIAFARMFHSLREGVYMGTLSANSTSTLAANPHLRRIFGYPLDAAENIVQPFDPSRFVDPQARQTFIDLLDRDEGVADYLLRVRKVDGTPIWVEVSATASHRPRDTEQSQLAVLHVEALVRDVSERKEGRSSRDAVNQLLQAEKMAALVRPSRAWRTAEQSAATILSLASGSPSATSTRRRRGTRSDPR